MIPLAADALPRLPGWALWLLITVVLILAALAVLSVRRMLVRPMRRTPTDTTDAWAEAGRRFQLVSDDGGDPDAAPDADKDAR